MNMLYYKLLSWLAKKLPRYKQIIYKKQAEMLTGVKKPTGVPVEIKQADPKESKKRQDEMAKKFLGATGIQMTPEKYDEYLMDTDEKIKDIRDWYERKNKHNAG